MNEQVVAAIPAGQPKTLVEVWEATGRPAPLTLLNTLFGLISQGVLQSVWTRSPDGSLSVAYARV